MKKKAALRTVSLDTLSAEQAYAVGAAVGHLLKAGMPTSLACDATVILSAFIERGQKAQAAVNAILVPTD